MTSSANPLRRSAGDHLVRGLLRDSTVRVVAAVTTDLTIEAARRHQAAPAAAVAMGRAATAGLLLATLTNDEERVTLRIANGDGSVRLTADANAAGEVRVYVKDPGDQSGASAAAEAERFSVRNHGDAGSPLVVPAPGSRGIIQVARDIGLRDVVSGQTELVDGEVDSDVEGYLRMSEQIDSVLVADVRFSPGRAVSFAGGLLLQALPDAGAPAEPNSSQVGSLRSPSTDEFLAGLRGRLRTARLTDANSPPAFAADLVRAALGESARDFQVLDVRPLRFHCPCSRQRAAATLALLGDELAEMAAKGESVDITCEFCRSVYEFSADELGRIHHTHRPS